MNEIFVTQEYLDEVRKRCDAATPGPWKASIEGRDHPFGGESVILRGPNWSESDLYLNYGSDADHDFIAHARQDIPILLDEIARLRRLLEKYQG